MSTKTYAEPKTTDIYGVSEYKSVANVILNVLQTHDTVRVNHKYLPDVLALTSEGKLRIVHTGNYYTEVELND